MNNIKPRLRVAFCSNHPSASSGYAQQTADIKRMFLASGWDSSNFALINMYGQNGHKYKDEDGIWNYPILGHVAGSDAMVWHGRHFGADIVISLNDIWIQNPTDLQQIGRFIPWLPIDYDPVPQMILNNVRLANRIIAMSKFGQNQLKEHGFASTYIPHHVDTDIFFPLDKKKRKAEVKIDPSMFVFGMVSANKDILPRKSYGQVLEAFARFHAKNPKSLLYMHTDPDFPGGYPIRSHVSYLKLDAAVGYPDKYKLQFDTPKTEMNMIYGAMDAYLMPSSTEGFGITAIEAQATGTPVIVNNYCSMPELVKENKTGLITKLGCQHYMPIGGYMKYPDTNDLYEKMEQLYASNLHEMGKNAHKWAKDNFALSKIWPEKWLPFLERLEKEIYGEPQQQVLTVPPASV